MFTLGFIYLFISSDFLPKSSVNNLWSQLTTSFHIAAYATSGFGVTPSEESSIRPLPHTYTHDWLVFRWLIRARVYDIPPTLKAWLVCCFGLLFVILAKALLAWPAWLWREKKNQNEKAFFLVFTCFLSCDLIGQVIL